MEDWLYFSTLEKYLFVGHILCIQALQPPLVTQELGAWWSYSSALPAFADSVYRLWACSFLAFAIFLLLSGAESWPSGGQDLVKRQLPAQEVFTQPVWWVRGVSLTSLLFGLRRPALEPTGCWVGPGLGAKMSAPTRAHKFECSLLNHYQCQCPQSGPQPTLHLQKALQD